MARSGQRTSGAALRREAAPALTSEILAEIGERATDTLYYDAGPLDEDGHKWCVLSAEGTKETLATYGIEAQVCQADWLRTAVDGDTVMSELVDGVGFCHPAAHDPSHCWVELADGTIVDPTISQFPVDDYPVDPAAPGVALVPPGHPFAAHYRLEPHGL